MTPNNKTRFGAIPRSKAVGLALTSLLALVLLAGAGILPVTASTSAGYNTVQVSIQTTYPLSYSYTLTAYNTSGYQVAYYQSQYPAAAMELPVGTYLFTVSATYSPSYGPCYVCVYTTSSPGYSANGTGTGKTLMPIRWMITSEYGYAIMQIDGPSSFTINTQNATSPTTSKVSIHVTYPNGTAAQGAWVYASVIGNYYFYGPNFVPSLQTDANGNAVLEMPVAPLLVTSYLSYQTGPVKGIPNENVTAGGVPTNRSAYEQSWVSLSGQTIVLPPQTSGTITLRYQPVMYYAPIPYGVKAPAGIPNPVVNQTASNIGANGTPQSLAAAIPGFVPTDAMRAPLTGSSTSHDAFSIQGLNPTNFLLVGAAIGIGALAFVLASFRGRRLPRIVPAH